MLQRLIMIQIQKWQANAIAKYILIVSLILDGYFIPRRNRPGFWLVIVQNTVIDNLKNDVVILNQLFDWSIFEEEWLELYGVYIRWGVGVAVGWKILFKRMFETILLRSPRRLDILHPLRNTPELRVLPRLLPRHYLIQLLYLITQITRKKLTVRVFAIPMPF